MEIESKSRMLNSIRSSKCNRCSSEESWGVGGVIADVSHDPGGILEGAIVRAPVYGTGNVHNWNISSANFDLATSESNKEKLDDGVDVDSGVDNWFMAKITSISSQAVRWMVQREKKQKLKSHTLCNNNTGPNHSFSQTSHHYRG